MEELGFRSLGRRKFSLCKNIIRQGPWNLTMGLCNAPLSVFSLFPPSLSSLNSGQHRWRICGHIYFCHAVQRLRWIWKIQKKKCLGYEKWRDPSSEGRLEVEVGFMPDMLNHQSVHCASHCFIWQQFQHSRTESSALLLWIRSECRSKTFGSNMTGSSYFSL